MKLAKFMLQYYKWILYHVNVENTKESLVDQKKFVLNFF